jgi:hypothetical protein
MESMPTGNSSLSEAGMLTTRLLKQLGSINLPFEDGRVERARAIFSAETDRFDLWAANFGLFDGQHSLDHHLIGLETLTYTLRKFIVDLNRAIFEGKLPYSVFLCSNNMISVFEYCNEDERAGNQESSCSTESAADELQVPHFDCGQDINMDLDLELLLDSIKEPIDCLYKLSPKISDSLSRVRPWRAQIYQRVDAVGDKENKRENRNEGNEEKSAEAQAFGSQYVPRVVRDKNDAEVSSDDEVSD